MSLHGHTGLIASLTAAIAGYLIGSIPVAWVMVRRQHGVDLRLHGRGGTGAIDALLVVGPRTALYAGLIEVIKGGLVGAVARAYGGEPWFAAVAIAGVVTGDAFPIGFRRGGRGLVPLISGLVIALPGAGVVTALVAIPAAALTRMRGHIYDAVILVAVPAGLLLGTQQWRVLAPALVMVAVLLLRARQRRRQPGPAISSVRPPATIVDQISSR